MGACPFAYAQQQQQQQEPTVPAAVTATVDDDGSVLATMPTRPLPSVGKFRTYFDLIFGGYLDKSRPLLLHPYSQALFSRLQSEVVHSKGLNIVFLCNPDDFMTVLRSEWSSPKGAAASLWLFKEVFREHGSNMPLGTLDGEDWAKKRHKVQPQVFLQSAIAPYVESNLAPVAKDAISFIAAQPNHTPVLKDLGTRVAFEMVTKVLIGLRVGLLTNSSSPVTDEFVKCAITFLEASGPLAVEADREKGMKMKEWPVCKTNLDRCLELGKVLLAESAASDVDCVFKRLKAKGQLAEEYLTVELAGLLAAGVDTTACTVQQSLFALARYPHAQAALRDEVMRVLGHDGDITAAKLGQMPYLRAFAREQHRLHFVANTNVRVEDYEVVLRNGEFRVPPKTMIMFDMRPYQSDPSLLFGDPDLFLPERWLNRKGAYDRVKGGGKAAQAAERGNDMEAADDSPHPTPGEQLGTIDNYVDLSASPCAPRSVQVFAPSLRVKHAMLETPFGLGPRQCLGGRLATLETQTFLCEVLRNFKLVGVNPLTRNTIPGGMCFPLPDPNIRFERL